MKLKTVYLKSALLMLGMLFASTVWSQSKRISGTVSSAEDGNPLAGVNVAQTNSYWSKAAILMLKADVFLWTSYRGGGAADASTAKNTLTDIQTKITCLTLLPNFASVFVSNNKSNNEIIFAIRNLVNETALPIAGTFLPQTSLIPNFWDSVGNRKFDATTDNWGGLLRAPVKIATYRKFNDLDTRKSATIQAAYDKVGSNYVIAGAFVKKYQGEQNAGSRYYSKDFPIYRYADLFLMLAEAKAILGEDPKTEINLVRARAYGANYNAATIGFPNRAIVADPKKAILEERYLEFIFEGKRWYDLRRFGESYVFANTTMPSYKSFRLLWPIDRASLTDNRALTQNPGYPVF
ncbi:MAG: RagB/SusD family nutrient uptake outer membrane protein [Chitinophagaceae bacterium]